MDLGYHATTIPRRPRCHLMPVEKVLTSGRVSRFKGPLARRRLLLVGGGLAVAVAVAACGEEEGGKGSRDDPFPYQDPRSRNTRL